MRSAAGRRRCSPCACGRLKDEGGIEIEISDDAPGERRQRSLEVLRERARTLGAAMHVDRADVGTTMRLVLPTYPRGE